MTLVYANRTHRTVMFLEEVEDLKDRYPDRFQLLHVLSREPQEVELFSGRLDADADGPDPGRRCCRRTPSTSGSCAGRSRWSPTCASCSSTEGVPSRPCTPSCSTSRPGPRSVVRRWRPRRREGASVTITLDGRTSTFALRPDGPAVLDAALQVRADAPFACKGGVCGTCRAKLLEGTVEMDTNWALEPEEVERGYVLTCQSHPTSDTVVLDYDA